MNVLSLFDGMSCGQQALERAGIKVDSYYASEVDPYAIQITMKNYPNTIQLGDVRNVNGNSLPSIDLLIGGSPCQSFSFAGRRKGMSTKDEQEILTLDHYLQLKEEGFEFEGQSYLFWEYMRLLNEVKPKYFLLENVMMSKKWKHILSDAIGCEPIMINSNLVSAQNRKRLYWTNIKGISILEDKGIYLKDVLEENPNPKYYLSDKMIEWLEKHANKRGTQIKAKNGEDKSSTITATATVKGNLSTDYIVAMRGRNPDNPKSRISGLPTEQMPEAREDGKTNCLTTVLKDNYVVSEILNDNQLKKFNPNVNADKHNTLTLAIGRAGSSSEYMNSISKIASITYKLRKLTPVESERLQTVKDNYTQGVSDSQRYRMLGNGWTVDVIAHIFKHLTKQ